MHNPLCLLTPELLAALVENGHRYFVRQSYARGLNPFNGSILGSFLVTHYTDISRAHIHYKALDGDRQRFLYQVELPDHRRKLELAAGQPAGYSVYTPLLEKEWRPPEMLMQKVRRYIDTRLHWKPGKKTGVKTELFLQFGELFITLKWKTMQVKLPLAELENS